MSGKTIATRAAKLLAFAKRKAKATKEWTELHNAVYGIGGKLVELFPTQRDRIAFMRTDEARQVNNLIDELQARSAKPRGARKNGTLIVRLPASIHEALAAEADAEGTSMNQLCLAKLAVQLRAVAN